MSAVHQLAHLFLRGPSVSRHPTIDPWRRDQAIAACHIGCDHIEGEELVAVIDDSLVAGTFVGAVVTSRRYAWRNHAGRGEVWWSNLARVDVELDALGTRPRCVMLDETMVAVPPTAADITSLFRGVVRLRGDERAISVKPLPQGRPAARRAVVARTQAQGRGQHFGAWVSASAPNELARAIAILLGPPSTAGATGEHYVCDFELSDTWQQVGVADGPPARRQAAREAGYGRPIQRLRLVTQPTWPGSTFTVHGLVDGSPTAPLSTLNPVLLATLFRELVRVEERLLATVPLPRASAPAHA